MEKELNVLSSAVNRNLGVIQLSGDMNIYNSSKLRHDFERTFRQGVKNFMIDLKSLNTIDSAGIGVLFTMLSMIEGDSGKAVLVGANQSIRKLFEVTQVAQYFTMTDSEQDAMNQLQSRASA